MNNNILEFTLDETKELFRQFKEDYKARGASLPWTLELSRTFMSKLMGMLPYFLVLCLSFFSPVKLTSIPPF